MNIITEENDIITTTEAEKITGISGGHLRWLCIKNKIIGAKKISGSFWLIPLEWAKAHADNDNMANLKEYVPLAQAARMANISREAMRAAVERGDVIGKKRVINTRGKWWINIGDPSFAEYVKKATMRSKWVTKEQNDG